MMLTIIVPVYNVEKYLKRFFKSLDRQYYDSYEVIFVNDGSTDGSLDLLKEYKKYNNRVRIINQRNKGTGNARNAGIKIAQGNYILFCDPDDYIADDYLYVISNEVENNPQLLMFGYNVMDENNQYIASHYDSLVKRYISKKEIEENIEHLYFQNSINNVWNKAYNTEFIMSTGILFPLNRTAQDALFNYEILNKVENLSVISNCIYNYIFDRKDSAQNILKKSYPDEYELLEKKINIFKNLDSNAEKMISISVIDFWTTQVIKYKGKLGREVKESKEFKQANVILKSKVHFFKLNIKYKIEFLLYFFNLYKVSYFFYSISKKVKN